MSVLADACRKPGFAWFPLFAVLAAPSWAFGQGDESVTLVADDLTWVRTGGPSGGLGYDIRMHPDDPDIMFVTDAVSGVFKSTDGGANWAPTNAGITTRAGASSDLIPIFSFSFDPNNPDILWCGTVGVRGIFKSIDGGTTWTKKDNGIVEESGLTVRGFAVEPGTSDVVYAATEVGSFVWNNGVEAGGASFDRTQGVVYKTTDGGENWVEAWRGDNLARYIWIDPRDTNVLYVSTGIFDREAKNSDPVTNTPGGVGVIKSIDGGATWNQVNSGLTNLYIGSLFMHPEDPDILLAGAGILSYTGGNGIYLTTSGGASWQQVLTGTDITAVEFALSNPDIAYAGSRDGIYRSTDGGLTWETVNGGIDEEPWGPPKMWGGFPIDILVDPENPDRLFVNSYGGGNSLSTDGGRSWVSASKGYTGCAVEGIAVDPIAPGRVYAAVGSGLYGSSNGGSDWSGLYAQGGWTFVVADPADHLHLLAATRGGPIRASSDGGDTWTDAAEPPEGFHWMNAAFAPSDSNTIYSGTGGVGEIGSLDAPTGAGVYVSHDGGATWTAANDATSADVDVWDLAIAYDDPQVVYVADGAGGVLKTTDGGTSWSDLQSALPGDNPFGAMSVAVHPTNSDLVFAGFFRSGLHHSSDGGTSWQQPTAGLLAEAQISAVVFHPVDPQTMFAGDRTSGAYLSTDGGVTWEQINEGLSNREVNTFAFSANGEHLYLGTQGGGVSRMDLTGVAPPDAEGFEDGDGIDGDGTDGVDGKENDNGGQADTGLISETSPADGDTDVLLGANIVIDLAGAFSEEGFDAWSTPDIAFALMVSDDGTALTLEPDEPLQPDTTYTMTVFQLMLDDGSELSEPYEFTFTTVGAGDPDDPGNGGGGATAAGCGATGGGCGAGVGILFINLLFIGVQKSRRRARR